MQIVSLGENLHEMSNPVLWKNKKSIINLSSAENAQKVVKVNIYLFVIYVYFILQKVALQFPLSGEVSFEPVHNKPKQWHVRQTKTDQPGHPPDTSMISVFAVRMKKAWVLSYPVSILYKSIAGRYRPVRVADGPITACYRFIKNACWVPTERTVKALIRLGGCPI